jgi:Protein of unknown function, DUF547
MIRIFLFSAILFSFACKNEAKTPVLSVDKITQDTSMASTPAVAIAQEPTPVAEPIQVGKGAPVEVIKEQKAQKVVPSGTNMKQSPTDRQAPAPVAMPEETVQTVTDAPPPPVEELRAATNPIEMPANRPDNSSWNRLLSTYVSKTGRVDYKAFKTEMAEVKAYLEQLNTLPPAADWSRDEAMAYWINAYNAGTVLLILENYPLKTIQSLDGGKTWDVKRITLGGKKYSLNQIENDILRAKYKDGRIHFAVNCAAKGCPPLANYAFEAAELGDQLSTRTRSFVRNKQFNQISANSAQVSKIFEWYASDFGDLRKFLNKWSVNAVLAEGAQITYGDYDWGLNE